MPVSGRVPAGETLLPQRVHPTIAIDYLRGRCVSPEHTVSRSMSGKARRNTMLSVVRRIPLNVATGRIAH
jgi:hypothetical protein